MVWTFYILIGASCKKYSSIWIWYGHITMTIWLLPNVYYLLMAVSVFYHESIFLHLTQNVLRFLNFGVLKMIKKITLLRK